MHGHSQPISGFFPAHLLNAIRHFAGKIPVLGALFRKKTKTAVKSNLLVFLKPKIIHTESDLTDYTNEKYNYMQDLQRSSNKDTRRLLHGSKPPVLPEQQKPSTNPNPPAPQ